MSGPHRLSERMAKLFLKLTIATALFLLLALILNTSRGFYQIEREVAIEGVGRTWNILDSISTDLDTICADYARWDDCYDYVLQGNASFIETNFTEDSLESLKVDLLAFYGANGKLLYSHLSPHNTDGNAILPHLGTENPLFSTGEAVHGYTPIGTHLYAVTAWSATKTDGSGTPLGRIIFARLVDDEFLLKVSRLTGLSVSMKSAECKPGFVPGEPTVERGWLRAPIITRMCIKALSGGKDIRIETSQPRTIMQFGHAAIMVLLFSIIFILAIAYIGIRITTRAIIIRPLEELERSLDGFDQEIESMSQRPDTVGRMATLIKRANTEIINSLELQEKTTEELERQVQKRTEELSAANLSLKIYKTIMEETSEAVVVTDLQSIILEANQATTLQTGYRREELVGVKPFFLINEHQEKPIIEYLESEVLEKGIWTGELWVTSKGGTAFPVWLTLNLLKDDAGRPERILGIMADISRIKEAEANLNRLAFFDTLTGLPNRSLFNDRFTQAIGRAHRNQSQLALLYLDLDHFKLVNDSWGHQAGDEVLIETGRRLLKQVRATDTVCRLGGDEFTVILEQIAKPEDARKVAEKIVHALCLPFIIGEHSIQLGTSIGIALYPEHAMDFDGLVRLADSAMYVSKQMGRGQYRFAADGLPST